MLKLFKKQQDGAKTVLLFHYIGIIMLSENSVRKEKGLMFIKKLVATITAVVLLLSCTPFAFADDLEGVFVPNFKTFISTLHTALQPIDPYLADEISEEFYIDGAWTATEYGKVYYYDRDFNKIEFEFDERSGFVHYIYVSMPMSKMDDWEMLYKDIMVAIAASIVPDSTTDLKQALFDGLYYDYVVDSPVSYVSMDWNSGVYNFTLTKSSGDLRYSVLLHVPETEE